MTTDEKTMPLTEFWSWVESQKEHYDRKLRSIISGAWEVALGDGVTLPLQGAAGVRFMVFSFRTESDGTATIRLKRIEEPAENASQGDQREASE